MSDNIWDQFDRMRQSIGATTYISREVSDALMEGFNRMREERDALTAHHARLIEAGDALRAELAFWQGSDHAPRSQEATDNWTVAVEEAPAESLAKLKEERDALGAHVIEKCESLKYRDSAQHRYNAALEDIRAYVETLSPTTSLARRDAALMQRLADDLESAEGPDAEAGDMWDASQCADWIREQAGRQAEEDRP